jgi:hypothetical protein
MSETQQRVFYEGLVAGLIGYVTVALVLGIVDLVTGRSVFYTVATLGQAVFGGAGGGEGTVTPAAVFTYNGVHVLAFVVFGIFVAWLVVETELHPGQSSIPRSGTWRSWCFSAPSSWPPSWRPGRAPRWARRCHGGAWWSRTSAPRSRWAPTCIAPIPDSSGTSASTATPSSRSPTPARQRARRPRVRGVLAAHLV